MVTKPLPLTLVSPPTQMNESLIAIYTSASFRQWSLRQVRTCPSRISHTKEFFSFSVRAAFVQNLGCKLSGFINRTVTKGNGFQPCRKG